MNFSFLIYRDGDFQFYKKKFNAISLRFSKYGFDKGLVWLPRTSKSVEIMFTLMSDYWLVVLFVRNTWVTLLNFHQCR